MTGAPVIDVLAAGGTVIAATHRLARQIRLRHDRSRAQSGARAWPTADVLPLDAWLRRTWEALALRDLPLGRRRLLSDDECRLVWRRVLAADAEVRLDAGVVVPLVAAGWSLCEAWGITTAKLRQAADTEDARMFARWAGAYTGELERRSWIDSAGLLRALADAGGDVTDPRIASAAPLGFAGFDPWTPALADLAAGLTAAGVPVRLIEPASRAGTHSVVCARNPEDELARAFAWAAGMARSTDGPAPTIIVPDLEREAERTRRLGLDALAPGWQLREPPVRPVALAVGRQLPDYPIVRCALELLQLLAFDLRFEQASLLLRSPYVRGAAGERSGRTQAELKLRGIPTERIRLSELLGVIGADAPEVRDLWREAAGLAGPFRERRLPPGRWASLFATWLTACGWPGDRVPGTEEYQAIEAWQRLLQAFAGTDEVAGALSLEAAVGVLGQQAADRPFEPESAAEAIQVLTLREAEWQDFDALWICGLTADRWPPPARPHPLIPLALQRAAGMPEATPSTLEGQTRRRFARLLASAEQVVLSWPAEQDDAETLPSPLLAGLGSGEPAAGEVALHPDRERIAGSGSVEVLAIDPAPPFSGGQRVRGGARVLAMQAVCPARAFVEFRLRGKPLEPPARPLDAAARGKVVHALLERLYRIEGCERGLGHVAPAELRGLYEPLVRAVLDEHVGRGDPYLEGLRRLETERLWLLLLTLHALELDRPGFSVETELARDVRIGPLDLKVRLDRLDRLEAGGELVIDYKTGSFDPGGWKRPRLPASQLPLYAVSGRHSGIAAIEVRAPSVRLRGVGEEGIGIPGIRAPEAFFREKGLDWDTALERWRAQLESLSLEFAAGDYRVNPADRTWAVGQFAGLTRIHEFLPSAADESAPEGDEE